MGKMKTCSATDKTCYDTEKDANHARMRMWGRDPSVDLTDLLSYFCEECKFFHIGHRSYFLKRKENAQEESVQGKSEIIS